MAWHHHQIPLLQHNPVLPTCCASNHHTHWHAAQCNYNESFILSVFQLSLIILVIFNVLVSSAVPPSMYMDVSIACFPWYIWAALYIARVVWIHCQSVMYNATQMYHGQYAMETSMYILGGIAELTRTLKMTRMMRLNQLEDAEDE